MKSSIYKHGLTTKRHKFFFLLAFSSISVLSALAQDYTYLVVRMASPYDYSRKTFFYSIAAENTNPYAFEIYKLAKYNAEKKAVNNEAVFYSRKKDSSDAIYNYFENTTEALLFLSGLGWELITVYPEIISGKEETNAGTGPMIPVVMVNSTPVYYFKKKLIKK